MRRAITLVSLLVSAFMSSATVTQAGTVSYAANFHTSKGTPVYDILLLESDGVQVHASIYASQLPGIGTSVISHDVPFVPVQTLVIGLTEGVDENGDDKTQIVMLLDSNFAAAYQAVPFSSIFVGAKHSLTIASLQAAIAGDATQLAWFTNAFWGIATGAPFASGGPFAVAEFTSLNVVGGSAAAGNWIINSFQAIPKPTADPSTALIDETAQIDLGPFDILITLDGNGRFRVDKTVTNNTGQTWKTFKIELGTGAGAAFVASPMNDDLKFSSSFPGPMDTTGHFPDVDRQEDVVIFTGMLAPGETARFVFDVDQLGTILTITVRQTATAAGTATPAASAWGLATLAVLLGAGATLKLRQQGSPTKGSRSSA